MLYWERSAMAQRAIDNFYKVDRPCTPPPTEAQLKAQAEAVAESERQGAEIYASWRKEDVALTEEERELVCGDQHTTIGSLLRAAAAY